MKTTQKTICSTVVMIACAISPAFGQPSQTTTATTEKSASAKDIARIMEACRIVATKHVEPPVIQQLVLSAARSVYALRQAEAPRDLSERISKLSTDKDFESLLKSVIGDTDSPDVDAIIEALLSRIPGGGTLVNAKEAKVDAQVSANKYVGVGIALSMKNDLPFIQTCFYGGPGFTAGVRSRDTILEIDGKSTANKELAEIVRELRGAEGSDVTLLLQHPTAGKRKIVVTRNVAFIPTVTGAAQTTEGKWIYRLPQNSDLVLLRIDRFGASTAHELRKLNASFRDKKPAGIILDLRAGGGALHNVVLVADQFLNAGKIGSTKIGDKETTYKSKDDCLFQDIPMVVLTSFRSSASSVFLAAALQDRDRAIVVGEPTNGVSYVRSQFGLSNGDQLVIPSGHIRRGNGTVLFSRQNPILMNASLMSARDHDHKSANVVSPNHIVFADKNKPTETNHNPSQKKSRDAILGKAVKVLVKRTQQQADVNNGKNKTAG